MAFDQLIISYASITLPPPFAFECAIQIDKIQDAFKATLELKYINREDLSEEEILEEGFTTNDDFTGEMALGKGWNETLKEAFEKTSIQKKESQLEHAFEIHLEFKAAEKIVKKGKPSEFGMWEYLSQELIQAVFEAAKIEKPFWLEGTRIQNGQRKTFEINASFLSRTASLHISGKQGPLAWAEMRTYMKTFFQPDYLIEEALEKPPKGNGYYIQTEPDIWYQARKSILNPTDDQDLVGKIEELMDEILK